ncbi:U3 snoRNP protein [Ptychographa xylographoides]|nr:U3 snoRNP protein [Ptychographa xylographoides]
MAPGLLLSPARSLAGTTLVTPAAVEGAGASPDSLLRSTLERAPYEFLRPAAALHEAALELAKQYLDPLANAVSQQQQDRLQESRKKRKRGEDDDVEARHVLRLRQVYLDGFGIEQIWEQARRVLDAGRQEIERSLGQIAPATVSAAKRRGKDERNGPIKMVRFDEDGFEEVTGTGDDEGDGSEPELNDASDEEHDLENDDLVGKLLDGIGDDDNDEDGEEEIEDEEDIEDDDADLNMDDDLPEAEAEVFKPDKHGLNDGFFSIDDFNRTSEFLEQQDAQDEGNASDEEDIDWDADPTSRPLPKSDGRTNGDDDDDVDDRADSDEEDGPTFGNADLNAPFSDTDDDSEADVPLEDTALSNTNAIKYADFFAPPPLPLSKKGIRKRPLPKTQPPASASSTTVPPPVQEDDIQRTISAVRRDLFEDESSEGDPNLSGDASDIDPADPKNPTPTANNNLSTHQKRRALLTAQIRRLEAANVAKRDWTLSGEARAAERPLNSLLEEDLDFERGGKPVPVITAEVSEDIEALIKRRILGRVFDEVIKRRPESLRPGGPSGGEAGEGVRRGRLELDDSKSKVGLGDLYAEDHLRATDPAAYVDRRGAGVKKQHEEISALWADVSAKLDALSSLHFRPKPVEVRVRTIGDVAAVRMEDARPSGVGVGAEQSMLAPQEIYAVGDVQEKGEVVRGTGMVAREEMTREEKLRRRRREKERIRKSGSGVRQAETNGEVRTGGEGKRGTAKKEVVADLKRGGVRVIDRKGEVREIDGKMARGTAGVVGGGGFKL